MTDKIKYIFTQRYKPMPARVQRDTIVIGKDGSVGVVKAGTEITVPAEDGKLEVNKTNE